MAGSEKRFLGINIPILFITLVVIILGCTAYLSRLGFMELMELKTLDMRFDFRGGIDPGSDVVLAVIDEKSLEEQGKWIWPRSKVARLITRLSDAGAAAVGLDIGFLEPDPANTSQTIVRVEEVIADQGLGSEALTEQLDALKEAGDHDRILAEALHDSKTPVVLGYFFQMNPEGLGRVSDETVKAQMENARGSRYQVIHVMEKGKEFHGFREAFMPQANISRIADATDFSGYFNMFPDRDGTVRWMPMVLQCRGEYFAPLALQTLRAARGEELSLAVSEWGVKSLRLGKENIPVNESGNLLINYRGKAKTFQHIPVTDIIEGRVSADRLKDKIVLVGATAIGIYDLRVTPLDNVFPGLEIHANVVDNILKQDFVMRPNWAQFFDLLAILAIGAILGILLPRWSVVPGGLMVLALFVVYIALCQFLFSRFGWVLNIVYPVSVLVLMYLAMTTYKYVVEERKKRYIKNAFSSYLAPSVVEQIMEDESKLGLGGQEREITAFFSDVQGFTSISERLSAHELVVLLNEFLTEMTNIILEVEGTVDKYEGDAIIAFFGAPLDMPDHAANACVACVKMQERLGELREKLKSEGRPELYMRIGLNTGLAVVGNMGSATRMDYTMMGDTVNTAARLEGVNKIYGTYTLISEATYADARHVIAARELDRVMVIGKAEPIKIYEVQGLPGQVHPKQTEANRLYAQGLAAYRARNWDEGIKWFGAALATRPEDGPSKTMFGRCQEYKKNPPGDDWNGCWSMTSK